MRSVFLGSIIAISIWACSGPKSQSNEETKESVSQEATAPAEEEARVFFKAPEDGATVSSPVFVEMGVVGMQVEPAGEVKEGFGHHHILINQEYWPTGEVIPATDTTIHFGKGQTNTSLELAPGNYTISLQFADGVHSSYGPDMAASIKVTVK
ncbi:MAG: DUF4399 domain-containing protein [Marinoscillum sp.]|uniref:DUF4399 domain-containing protein n=1 Tax=Marinoscillum sp. TaxID=2024838 RepID=UPI003303F324